MPENGTDSQESMLPRLRARLAMSLARPEVAAAAAGLNATIRFETEAGACDILVKDGVGTVDNAPGAPDITISAPSAAWIAALDPIPRPGFQSFTAWQISNPSFTVSGEPLIIAQARPFLEVLVENLRPHVPQAEAPTQRSFEGIEGRYHLVARPSGLRCPIYAETAGDGQPLLCLHTAGADSRQYHGLLTDLGLRKAWRIIAFDMPFHGRSLPTPDWVGARYALDQASYRDWCAAFIEEVVQEPVVLVGCSMGAAIAMVLAAERPDLVCGLIALEAPVRPRGRRNPYLTHVAVHGGMHSAAYVRGLMAPSSPTRDRTIAAFIYSQGAPGIYDGDLVFYSDEFDGEEVARRIDGKRIHTYFLTGRYDYSATVEDARMLAGWIEGSTMIEMPDLGHFPMVENPERFAFYLRPVLDALGGTEKRSTGANKGQGAIPPMTVMR